MPLLRSWEKSIATGCYQDFVPRGAAGGGPFGQSSKCRTLGLALWKPAQVYGFLLSVFTLASAAAISSQDGARHSCRRPPLRLVAAMTLPSGEIIVGHKGPPSPSSVRVSSQVEVSYKRIASRSPAATASLLPSGKKAAPQTLEKKPPNVF